jgi:hypothetical protein
VLGALADEHDAGFGRNQFGGAQKPREDLVRG